MKNVHLSKIHMDRGWVWMGVQGRERHRAERGTTWLVGLGLLAQSYTKGHR